MEHTSYVTKDDCTKRMQECDTCIHNLEERQANMDLHQAKMDARLDIALKLGWYILAALILGFVGTIGATVATIV